MAITYKVLGQINPAAATATTLYTVPATVSAVVSTIVMCNQAATATTFSLSIRPAGATVDTKHYLNFNTAIAANDMIPLTLGLTLAPTDVLTASSASGTVSFSAFGAESTLATSSAPIITNLYITDSSYVTQPETVLPPGGGYIKLIGLGFESGCVIYINGVAVATTVISSTELRAALSAKTVGTYSVMAFNTTGSGAIYANGVVYSSVPTWTATSYNNPNTGNVVNVQLLATGDVPLTYSLQAGSTLPTGVTLSSTGLVSGTATGITSTTTVTFTAVVQDVELQSAPQLISLSLTFYVGKLYSWGRNDTGSLGQGDTIGRSSPTQVGNQIEWVDKFTAGDGHNISPKIDGTLWAWGQNSSGKLGIGDASNRSSPVQVGALTNWLLANAGGNQAGAIKTNGTIWTWGLNTTGALGLGDTIDRSSPVQVGALTNWLNLTSGFNHTIAAKTDGTLWSWGASVWGQLGDGTTINRSSPVQVGSLNTWNKISNGRFHSVITKTDGTLWTWGRNVEGQLGDGTTIDRSSPVQVGSLNTWYNVAGGDYFTIATKTDGTLWVWGANSDGQLGKNDTISRSSPVQVGALTTWSKIDGFSNHTITITTGGQLWTWGRNSYGQLGFGDTIMRSSPVQVGSATTWTAIATGPFHTLAISS